MAANQNPNPQVNNPQQPQQAPMTSAPTPVQQQPKEEHKFGWGALLLAGCVGFILGQAIQVEEPAPVKNHFWES